MLNYSTSQPAMSSMRPRTSENGICNGHKNHNSKNNLKMVLDKIKKKVYNILVIKLLGGYVK